MEKMIVGDQWLECLLSIPVIAIVRSPPSSGPAPDGATDLTRTGALGRLVAGGLSATAYAFHCMDDSLPFVALWYGGPSPCAPWPVRRSDPRLLRW